MVVEQAESVTRCTHMACAQYGLITNLDTMSQIPVEVDVVFSRLISLDFSSRFLREDPNPLHFQDSTNAHIVVKMLCPKHDVKSVVIL